MQLSRVFFKSPRLISTSISAPALVIHTSCSLAFVILDNFEMKDDEITLNGFLELNLMEAQDADGDPNDLWVTLGSMGYNNALELDQVLISSNTQP